MGEDGMAAADTLRQHNCLPLKMKQKFTLVIQM